MDQNQPKKRSPRGAVSIDIHRASIRLRFTYHKERFTFLTKQRASSENLSTVRIICTLIEHDIKKDDLDRTLERYRHLMTKVFGPTPGMDSSPVISTGKEEKTPLLTYFAQWIEFKLSRQEIAEPIPSFYYVTERMLSRWGNISVKEIEKKLFSEGYSVATFNDRLSVLKSFFSWAVKRKHIRANPLEEIMRKKGRKVKDPKRKPFTIDELRRILTAIESDEFCPAASHFKHSHYAPFLKFMIYTGVRNAEAVGLTVEKVDFKNKVITIDQSYARTVKGTHAAARILKETKTGSSRYLPMPEELRLILEPLCLGKEQSQFVFLSPRGLPIDDRMFQRRIFRLVLSKLGLEPRVLYSLRHSFGTRAVEQGMNLYQVAQLMGHASMETTMRNYIHLINRPKELPGI
jgi:integrase